MQDDKPGSRTTPDEVIEQLRAAMFGSLGWADSTLQKQRTQIRKFIGAVYSAGYQILPCEVVQE